MCFSRPRTPEVQPVQQAPQQTAPAVQQAAVAAQSRAKAAAGSQSTILTNERRVDPTEQTRLSSGAARTQDVPVIGKTLLGQ